MNFKRLGQIALTAGVVGGGTALLNRYVKRSHGQTLPSYLVQEYLTRLNLKEEMHEQFLDENIDETIEEFTQKNRQLESNPFASLSFGGKDIIYEDMQVFVWNDKGDPDQDVLIYLHGGAYIRQPRQAHYFAVNQLGKKTGAKIVMPIYLKAPEFTYDQSIEKLIKLYQKITDDKGDDAKIHLGGDSAGGGLVLGLTYALIDENIPQPDHLIMICPWLDITNSHEKMEEGIKREIFFDLNAINKTAKLWAGSQEERLNKYTSPKLGNLDEISGQITLLVGTHEAMYYDVVDFAKRLEKEGKSYRFFLGEHQTHCWPIYPTPEGSEARSFIIHEMSRLKAQYKV